MLNEEQTGGGRDRKRGKLEIVQVRDGGSLD